MSELDEAIKGCSVRVRSAEYQRGVLHRVVCAMRACGVNADRFCRKLKTTENALQVLLHEAAELSDAKADCAGDAALEDEVMRALNMRRGPTTGPHREQAWRNPPGERAKKFRASRSRLRATLPPLDPLPALHLSLDEAAAVIAEEIKVRTSQIGDAAFALGECGSLECEARLMLAPAFPFAPVLRASALPCCDACRSVVNETDTLKADVEALSLGVIRMSLVNMARRRGRPKL